METKDRARANDPGMPAALKRHLSDCHANAVRAQTVAEAVEMLADKGMAQHKTTLELLAVLVGLVCEVQHALDVVNLPLGEVA